MFHDALVIRFLPDQVFHRRSSYGESRCGENINVTSVLGCAKR